MELCRLRDPPQAENPAEQDSIFIVVQRKTKGMRREALQLPDGRSLNTIPLLLQRADIDQLCRIRRKAAL